MNTVMKNLVEKFNEKEGKDAAKLVGDDGDSFRMEFSDEHYVNSFQKFMQQATKKSIITEPFENIFGKNNLVRVFFEKPAATEIIEILKIYEEGTLPRKVECCGDGCAHQE